MFDVLWHEPARGAEGGSQAASSDPRYTRPAYNPLLAAMLGAGVICGGPETRIVRKKAGDRIPPNARSGTISRTSQRLALSIPSLRGLMTLAPTFRLRPSM